MVVRIERDVELTAADRISLARNAGRPPAALARRIRWLLPLALVGAAVLGWSGVASVDLRPTTLSLHIRPILSATDGMPTELIAGRTYIATWRVDFPPGWLSGPWMDGDDRVFLTVTGRGRSEDDPPGRPEHLSVIYCTAGHLATAGPVLSFACPIHVPSPGPFTLYLSLSTSFLSTSGGRAIVDLAKEYRHVVRAAG